MDKPGQIIDISPQTLVKLATCLNGSAVFPLFYAETEVALGLTTPPMALLEIYLLIEGEMLFVVGDKRALARQGDVVLANARFGNRGIPKSERAVHGCISFNIENSPEFETWNKVPVLQVSRVGNLAGLRESYRRVCRGRIVKSDPLEPLRHKVDTLRLLIDLYEAITAGAGRSADTAQDDRLEYALRLIQERSGDAAFSVTELAARMNLSPDYLGRLLTRGLGVSPHQYLLRYRIERASSLLRRTRLSIKQVAQAVGFNDPLYFSRAFRKIVKRSPREFRNEFLNRASATF